ncbi:MAG: rod shape-determining protein, partial [Cetobacterium sp.]
ESLSLEVTIAEDPLNAVVNGIQQLLKEFDKYKRVLISPESDY